MKKKFRLNNIENFIIFGGGELLIDICNSLNKNKKNFVVISSKNQINEKITSFQISLKDFFVKNKVKFIVLKNLKNYSKWKYLINENTIGISHSSKWIFTKKEINLFQNRLFNIHYSNLPSFRGAGGLTWNILSKNFYSGTTIHFIDEKIDSGYSIINKSFLFPVNIRKSLHKMQKYSLKFQRKVINEFLNKIFSKKSFQVKKIENSLQSFYWPRLNTKKNAWINWSWGTNEIIDFIDAFSHPYDGAATFFKGKIVRIFNAKISSEKIKFHPFQYGLIYRVLNDKVYVASKNNGIIIDIKFFKSKKGVLGKRLYTPKNFLEKSLSNIKN